jgi:hypothetical protein
VTVVADAVSDVCVSDGSSVTISELIDWGAVSDVCVSDGSSVTVSELIDWGAVSEVMDDSGWVEYSDICSCSSSPSCEFVFIELFVDVIYKLFIQ